MPTGYTAKIGDGESFNDFVLGCARAFGACVMQRNNDLSEKPKLQKPSIKYHENNLKTLEQEKIKIVTVDEDEIQKIIDEEYEKEMDRITRMKEKDSALAKKYDAMLKKVKGWKPPTDDHKRLKTFMVEQIISSKNFDCGHNYEKEINKKPINIWREEKLLKIESVIQYHKIEIAKEIERTEGRNKWIKELYKSLGLDIEE